jgi:hypothetical protein
VILPPSVGRPPSASPPRDRRVTGAQPEPATVPTRRLDGFRAVVRTLTVLVATPAQIRLGLAAVATFQIVISAAVVAVIAGQVWLMDAARGVDAAHALASGTFGIDRGYLYSPLAALLILATTWIPAGLAGGAWLAARFGVLLAGIRHQTRGLATMDRVLIAIAATAFLPTVHDLMLGNVSILLAGAVALVAWAPDRLRTGVPLGLALAIAPKPALIPILVWMLVFRRRALAGSLGTATAATIAAIAVVGSGPYLAWIEVLRHPQYLAGPQGGNFALTGFFHMPVALGLSALAVAAGLLALRQGETPGLLAAVAVGLLVAPYTLAYGAVFLLLAVRPLAGALPAWLVLLAALAAPVFVIEFLPGLAAALLAAAVLVRPWRWPPLGPSLEQRFRQAPPRQPLPTESPL